MSLNLIKIVLFSFVILFKNWAVPTISQIYQVQTFKFKVKLMYIISIYRILFIATVLSIMYIIFIF